MRTQELFDFIWERHNVYKLKQANLPKPWTGNPILQRYRFCNVYRELDKVTAWIRENWRLPNTNDPDLWFAMVVARKINWPDTLEEIGYPVPWDPAKFVKRMKARAKRKEQLESGAYMITAGVGPNWKGTPKYLFLASEVFTPLWKKRAEIRPKKGERLSAFHFRLQDAGMTVGSFIAAQVVADAKFHGELSKAEDWWTFAAPGPGSLRGMNRVMDWPFDQRWKYEDDWRRTLSLLQIKIDKLTHDVNMPRISAQDLQNCLCEFDKYERVRLGEGRPKQLYPGI